MEEKKKEACIPHVPAPAPVFCKGLYDGCAFRGLTKETFTQHLNVQFATGQNWCPPHLDGVPRFVFDLCRAALQVLRVMSPPFGTQKPGPRSTKSIEGLSSPSKPDVQCCPHLLDYPLLQKTRTGVGTCGIQASFDLALFFLFSTSNQTISNTPNQGSSLLVVQLLVDENKKTKQGRSCETKKNNNTRPYGQAVAPSQGWSSLRSPGMFLFFFSFSPLIPFSPLPFFSSPFFFFP